MSLPKVDSPTYLVQLTSLDKKIKYRPYTIGEEKVLLMATESESSDDVLDATVNICQACVLDDIDIQDLPLFDLEKLLIAIRSKSVGETVEVLATCPFCEEKTQVNVDIQNIVTDDREKPTKKIMLSDKVGISLEYPSIRSSTSRSFIHTMNITEAIRCCITQVFNETEVFSFSDEPEEEQTEFIESLSAEHLNTITNEFFDKMPINVIDMDYTCPHCEKKVERRFENLLDFFI